MFVSDTKRRLHHVLIECYTSTISYPQKKHLDFSKRVLKIGGKGGGIIYGFTSREMVLGDATT